MVKAVDLVVVASRIVDVDAFIVVAMAGTISL